MVDGQREIVGIVWKPLGNRIEVTYSEGEPERMRASERVAAHIARDAGLTVVPTADNMTQWVRDPDAWTT